MNTLISAYLPEDLAKELEDFAKKNSRSKSRIVRFAVREYLKREGAAKNG